jgi:hypothetical protein
LGRSATGKQGGGGVRLGYFIIRLGYGCLLYIYVGLRYVRITYKLCCYYTAVPLGLCWSYIGNISKLRRSDVGVILELFCSYKTPQNTVLPENLIVQEILAFYELECSMPCPQQLATCPHPQSHVYSPCVSISLRSILIFSSHLRLDLTGCLLTTPLPTTHLYAFHFFPHVLHDQPNRPTFSFI